MLLRYVDERRFKSSLVDIAPVLLSSILKCNIHVYEQGAGVIERVVKIDFDQHEPTINLLRVRKFSHFVPLFSCPPAEITKALVEKLNKMTHDNYFFQEPVASHVMAGEEKHFYAKAFKRMHSLSSRLPKIANILKLTQILNGVILNPLKKKDEDNKEKMNEKNTNEKSAGETVNEEDVLVTKLSGLSFELVEKIREHSKPVLLKKSLLSGDFLDNNHDNKDEELKRRLNTCFANQQELDSFLNQNQTGREEKSYLDHTLSYLNYFYSIDHGYVCTQPVSLLLNDLLRLGSHQGVYARLKVILVGERLQNAYFMFVPPRVCRADRECIDWHVLVYVDEETDDLRTLNLTKRLFDEITSETPTNRNYIREEIFEILHIFYKLDCFLIGK